MDSFLGEILFFAGNYTPVNYLPCDGRTLNISEYNALYSLLGTTFGGNGTTTFALPDLRGRIPVGYGTNSGFPGNVAMGAKLGTAETTLTTQNIPPHTHTIIADSSAQAAIADPTSALLTNPTDSSASVTTGAYAANVTTGVAMAPQSVGAGGGAQAPAPLDNRMPTMALTPIMCVLGQYPVRP